MPKHSSTLYSNTVIAIPARLDSQRLPKKALALLAGIPMVVRVAQQAAKVAEVRVVVATDSQEIIDACSAFNVTAHLTSSQHQSGTDRIAEIARHKDYANVPYWINLQGDEPFVRPSALSALITKLKQNTAGNHCIVTQVTPLQATNAEASDPNWVKAVRSTNGHVLYFSRAPIPHMQAETSGLYLRHIGLYGFLRETLLYISQLPPSALEQRERLEQLRWLEKGIPIIAIDGDSHCNSGTTNHVSAAGIDTQDDLDAARKRIKNLGSNAFLDD